MNGDSGKNSWYICHLPNQSNLSLPEGGKIKLKIFGGHMKGKKIIV
jgi:hypothetical protein